MKIKLKTARQEESHQKWKEHFKDLLENPPETSDKPTGKIINGQLNVKFGQFTEEELDANLKIIKSRKSEGLVEIPPEERKIRTFDGIFLRLYNVVCKQNTIDTIFQFPKKDKLRIRKNYRGISRTAIVFKFYFALLLNRVQLEVEIFLRQNQKGFQRF